MSVGFHIVRPNNVSVFLLTTFGPDFETEWRRLNGGGPGDATVDVAEHRVYCSRIDRSLKRLERFTVLCNILS